MIENATPVPKTSKTMARTIQRFVLSALLPCCFAIKNPLSIDLSHLNQNSSKGLSIDKHVLVPNPNHRGFSGISPCQQPNHLREINPLPLKTAPDK
jgi:hypothetical protein